MKAPTVLSQQGQHIEREGAKLPSPCHASPCQTHTASHEEEKTAEKMDTRSFLAIQSFSWLLRNQTKDPVEHSDYREFPRYTFSAIRPATCVKEERSRAEGPCFMVSIFWISEQIAWTHHQGIKIALFIFSGGDPWNREQFYFLPVKAQ